MSGRIDLSIVLPVYNERENLRPLVGEIGAALADCDWEYEVVAVDDGSTDGSGARPARAGAQYRG